MSTRDVVDGFSTARKVIVFCAVQSMTAARVATAAPATATGRTFRLSTGGINRGRDERAPEGDAARAEAPGRRLRQSISQYYRRMIAGIQFALRRDDLLSTVSPSKS
jgi:hypothetical protein